MQIPDVAASPHAMLPSRLLLHSGRGARSEHPSNPDMALPNNLHPFVCVIAGAKFLPSTGIVTAYVQSVPRLVLAWKRCSSLQSTALPEFVR